MTPESVISDLIYLERYHRSHGAPLTAEAITRARALIHRQQQMLGQSSLQVGEAVMAILVSDYESLHLAVLQSHKTLVQVHEKPTSPETKIMVHDTIGLCHSAIYNPPKNHDDCIQSVA